MATFATVGLTGGIASGKSAVARIFAELGVGVVDADRISREVVVPGSEGHRALVAEFGDVALQADGGIDRKGLGAIVFGDAVALGRLNAIMFPLIAAESARQLAALAQSGAGYGIYEAAILIESGMHRTMSAVIVVAADEAAQLERMRTRDGFDEAAARARLSAQLPLADKLAVADYVIENKGSLDELRRSTVKVNDALRARFGGGGAP